MDAYDHMVAYLTQHPAKIEDAWYQPGEHVCGALFAFVNPTGEPSQIHPSGKECGCLTMIRSEPHEYKAWDEALHVAICGDERLPKGMHRITPDHLPIFAGWQRRIDKILNRTPPVWNGPPCAKPEVEMGEATVAQPEAAQ